MTPDVLELLERTNPVSQQDITAWEVSTEAAETLRRLFDDGADNECVLALPAHRARPNIIVIAACALVAALLASAAYLLRRDDSASVAAGGRRATNEELASLARKRGFGEKADPLSAYLSACLTAKGIVAPYDDSIPAFEFTGDPEELMSCLDALAADRRLPPDEAALSSSPSTTPATSDAVEPTIVSGGQRRTLRLRSVASGLALPEAESAVTARVIQLEQGQFFEVDFKDVPPPAGTRYWTVLFNGKPVIRSFTDPAGTLVFPADSARFGDSVQVSVEASDANSRPVVRSDVVAFRL